MTSGDHFAAAIQQHSNCTSRRPRRSELNGQVVRLGHTRQNAHVHPWIMERQNDHGIGTYG